MLDLILSNQYSIKQLDLIIMQKFCLLNGISLEVNKCVVCGSRILKTLNFNLRNEKAYSLEENKLFYYLFNNEYKKTSMYAASFDFAIKLLKEYIDNNLGIKFDTLFKY